MKMTIESITMRDFKGIKSATYNFNGKNTSISGKNGEGKTSIMTAWMFLMANCDAELNSNPNIRPLNEEECIPRVEAVINVDGKKITVAKQQKRSVSKPDINGVSKVTLTNSYEVNSVPKSERDFKAYLSKLGLDFEHFIALSHTDVFTSQKTSEMRKVLFEMVSNVSDIDVARSNAELSNLTALLENYTVEEVTAIQKATLRKISEDYGKEGEILRAKIDGLASARIEADLSAAELGKADCLRRLEEAKKRNEALAETEKKISDMRTELMNLKFKQGDVLRNATAELDKSRNELNSQLREITRQREDKHRELLGNQRKIQTNEETVTRYTEAIKDLRKRYKTRSEEIFKEENAICPVCGQTYPSEKLERVKANFETSKAKELESITDRGNEAKQFVDEAQRSIKDLTKFNARLEKEMAELDSKIIEINEKLKALSTTIDPMKLPEYVSLAGQISELETRINGCNITEERNANLVDIERINAELAEYQKILNSVEFNENIERQIEELRIKQMEYEQSKANAEEILFKISILNKAKNEMLTDEINSHFKLVKFVLFDYLKNGTCVDACVPTIDGKALGVSTNTGREVLAKIDIASGLQNYYGMHLPVFLDGAECLSEETKKRINIDSQFIALNVTESALKVEEM